MLAIKQLKNKFKGGADVVLSFRIKNSSNIFVKFLYKIYNLILKNFKFQEMWLLSRLFLILKSADTSLITDHHSIVVICK